MFRTLGVVEYFTNTNAPATMDMHVLSQRRLAGKPLVEWVARRVSDCEQLDGVVALCDTQQAAESLELLLPADVPVVVGDGDDALSAYRTLITAMPCEMLVRICGHHPLVDPVLIDRLAVSARQGDVDYVSYVVRGGRPAAVAPLGVFAELCRAEAMLAADREAREPADRQEPTRYLYSHPEKFTLRLIPAPPLLDRDDLRLSLQVDADWDHLQEILEVLGPEQLDWQHVASLLGRYPEMRQRMARLNRDVQPV